MGGGGGFGKKSDAPKKKMKTKKSDSKLLPDDDYANIPRLSERDLEYLRPASSPIISEDIIDSLNGPYGFRDFETEFPGLKVLHEEPLVLSVENFFSPETCDDYIKLANEENTEGTGALKISQSKTLDHKAKAERTSTTWFHHYSTMYEMMAKACKLLGCSLEQWEEPQTVRYRPSQKFTWHLDALPPTPREGAGQRIATLLVYLTDMKDGDGGATLFRDLGPLRVQPVKGSALLFFPSAGGVKNAPFDMRTVHAGEVVSASADNDKWIAQLWLRERSYQPTMKGNSHSSAKQAINDFTQEWWPEPIEMSDLFKLE